MSRITIRVQKRTGLPGWWVMVGGLALPWVTHANAAAQAVRPPGVMH